MTNGKKARTIAGKRTMDNGWELSIYIAKAVAICRYSNFPRSKSDDMFMAMHWKIYEIKRGKQT
jgi:hypothetical protein